MKLALVSMALVGVGSLVVIVWVSYRLRDDSRRAFVDLAETNVRFLEHSSFPTGPRLAADLGDVLGMTVVFDGVDAPADGRVRRLEDGRESIILPVGERGTVAFTRDPPSAGIGALLRVSAMPLAILWGAAAAVGGVFARSLAAETARRAESERLAMLGQMATGLAHEIRNPVAAIRLHAQLAGRGGSPELIVAEAEKIEGLVKQWMFLARPEPPARSRQEIGPVVGQALAVEAPAMRHAAVTVEVAIPDGLEALVDASRFGQALGNLLRNATQAMPDGGRIRVRARREGGGVSLVVEDDGPGFSPAALSRFGEAFFSEKEGGMGIGIGVAKGIIEAHGGRIAAANAGGGRVAIWIPDTHEL